MYKVEGFDSGMTLEAVAGFNSYCPDRDAVWPGTQRSVMASADLGAIQKQTVQRVFNRSALIAALMDGDEDDDCGAEHHQTGCHITAGCQKRFIAMSCLHLTDEGGALDFYQGVGSFLYGVGALESDKRHELKMYAARNSNSFSEIDGAARRGMAGYKAVRAVQYPARQKIAPLVHEIHNAFRDWMEYNGVALPS